MSIFGKLFNTLITCGKLFNTLIASGKLFNTLITSGKSFNTLITSDIEKRFDIDKLCKVSISISRLR
jgi:hypothetical protein